MTGVWGSSVVLWHQGDVLEREWPSRRLVRRLETLRHLSRRSLCHRTHTVVLFHHRRHLFLRQIPWQEFVVSFERAFCPTYVRTERLYQFLDLQQRDFTVVQYKARFVELGCYAPQIMADEGLRTQQFVRGLRPELRQALIVARVTDLDAAYQTAAALEADTLRTCAQSAEGSLRSRYRVLLLVSVTGVTRWVTWREIVLCYLVCRSSRPSHSLECSSSSNSSKHLYSSVSRPEVLVGREVEVVLLT
ncbi:hypothetical protein Taro_020398 [Colocasia esculenta]|uniref:Retrotransposon gag domain-containing protein n=1 Tax=Colocasia esculenta TaxID=4460 RepID=A0A843UZH7_COLES|nr:hypothetical protein [Colocasia esculenta]